MAISKRITEMMINSSFIRKMFETGNQLKAKYGKDAVCDFSLGNPSLPPPAQFKEVLIQLAALDFPGKHAYMPNAGYPDVRKRLADYISREWEEELPASHVIMTCGAGGGLNVILKTLLNPGDEVLVSTPYFVEYKFYADNHGGKLVTVPGTPDLDLDPAAIEAAITPATACVLINSPNNPSGRVYPQKTITALAAMLTRKSKETGRTIYLVSDEPYRKLVYDGICVPSVLKAYPHSIVVTSYSKELSIPGERIGWLAVNPRADAAAELVDGAILCNRILGFVNAPALMQKAVVELSGVHVDVELYRRKRDRLCTALKEIGYQLTVPAGTFYIFPHAPGSDDMKTVDVLQQQLVLVVPGSGFGAPGYFRIAYCVDDDVIERSLDPFARAFARLN